MINYRFIIKKKLGEGRSKVFLCGDLDNPGTDYAIKILPANKSEEEIKTFRNEFFILQNFNHPHIINSHEEGTIVQKEDEQDIELGSRFIILEYFEGSDLLNYKKMDDHTLKIILKQICSVLYYLHQSNYIYYDLKPENILVGDSDNLPYIKFIDVGFTHHLSSSNENIFRGTREYIAPEILRNHQQSHQVDLYSLGMLLYRLIYKKFPFTSDEELQIYKEQIEKEFEFPDGVISDDILSPVKKMLQKNPVERFDNSLQVLKHINAAVDGDTVKYFTPANTFSGRKEIISLIENFIIENFNKNILIISGSEGSGKTSLLYKIYSDYKNIVLVSGGYKRGTGFIKAVLKKIIYTDFIYPHLDEVLIGQSENIFTGNYDNLINSVKAIFNSISSRKKFNLIIDDFNLLDEFSLDIMNEILPILQVNGVNVILSQRSDQTDAAGKIVNKSIKVNLAPFTGEELDEYLDTAFATFFPKDQLKKLIIRYADLLPGSIVNFIKDLILLEIIKFTYDGPEIVEDEKTEKFLESSYDEIFRLRFELLSPDEIKVAQLFSSFNNPPSLNIISGMSRVHNIPGIISSLKEKNIFQVSHIENDINFTSDSLKKYIYSSIQDKEKNHKEIAEFISRNFSDFNRNELARQYELAKDYSSSYGLYLTEINEAGDAYSYIKNLLNHLLNLPLPEENIIPVKYRLADTLCRLNDAKAALSLIKESLKDITDDEIKNKFLELKGSCLIELGDLKEGKELLMDLVEKIKDDERKQKILIEIAYAELDLGRYEESKEYARKVLSHTSSSLEDKAKCHNLLGLINIYLNNDLSLALKEFEQSLKYYKQINSVLQEAKLERNIGNIYNMKGNHTNAEQYWNSAHAKNLSIGNLDQEAKHLLNYGIYYYELADFDNALKQYNQAAEIFSVLGNRQGEGLAYTNLGEINTDICNYSDALKYLNTAGDIFNTLNIFEEETEVLFLQGKLFSSVGDNSRLKEIISEYRKRIREGSERHKNNLELLEYLSGDDSGIQTLRTVKIKYDELNDFINYAKVNILHCESLISLNNSEEAFNVINEENFLQLCSKNPVIKAHREFLIGEISTQNEKVNPNPLKNYNAAYEILKDSYVTELTWNVLLKLGEIYTRRGNYIKAGEYIIYAKKLIYYIADHIRDTDLKEKYLNYEKRKKAVEMLNLLEKELS